MAEIEINGKILPLHFGLKTINQYSKTSNTEFKDAVSSTQSLSDVDNIVILTKMGLNDGARRSNSDKRYTDDDVWDMIDDDPTIIEKVGLIFLDSITPLIEKLGIDIKKE